MRRRFLGGIKEKNNIIYYTSTDNLIIVPYRNNFGTTMINNKMSNSIGIMTFLSDITTIGDYTFYEREKLKSITIPNSVTSIGSNAFRSCFNLTTITIPDSVTSIGDFAFFRCRSLTSITIPNGVTSIDNSAFYECSILASVTIGDSVTSIGDSAFSDCLGLTSVYCKPTTPPILNGTSVFDNNGSGRKIYVPYQSLDAYKTATYWSEYTADIVGYDFENDTVVGKIVNHGVITTSSSNVTLTFEYPVATNLEVSCGDVEFILVTGSTQSNYSIGPGESLGSTVSFYPSNEDDTYIYEVVIEY